MLKLYPTPPTRPLRVMWLQKSCETFAASA